MTERALARFEAAPPKSRFEMLCEAVRSGDLDFMCVVLDKDRELVNQKGEVKSTAELSREATNQTELADLAHSSSVCEIGCGVSWLCVVLASSLAQRAALPECCMVICEVVRDWWVAVRRHIAPLGHPEWPRPYSN